MEVAAAARAAAASPLASRTTEVLAALAHRADQAQRELITTHHAFVSSRTQRLHGALSIAVAHAQQVLRALEAVREQRDRERHQQRSGPSASPSTQAAPPSAESRAPTKEEHQLHMRLEKARIDLRRVLPRSVAEVEDTSNVCEGDRTSTSDQSAARTAAALRSLLHTRSMLSVELKKMDTAVQGLAGSSESLATLQQSLQDVHSSMEMAQRMVRTLLRVQSRDDLLLRVSAVLFVLVVFYVVAQRVFRLFPTTVYVTVAEV
ncbi:putative Sec20 [Leishmania naiffi]|uniref:Sec20 n=1 Tax=Leishmania naiffi TaxID=5678 RepID=A0AAW3BU25_9TRYP